MGKKLSNIDLNNNSISNVSELKTTNLLRYADNGTGRGDLGFTTWNDGTNPWGGAMEFYSSAHATNPGYVNFVIGNTANNAKLQFVSHSAANVYDVEAWINQDGSATFTGDVTVPDEAYSGSWDGSLEVPTKNAVYDKIQTMGGSGTNLSQTLNSTQVQINSDTGGDVVLVSADATNAGILTSADKVKLDGIATGATANTGDVTQTGTQTLTNKTLTSPVINTPTGIVKADVGLSNVDNTSNATERAATATLTNKTISGSDNTFSNVPTASLTTSFQRVIHGATAGTARPTGITHVEWVGSVAPTNGTTADTWVDTA